MGRLTFALAGDTMLGRKVAERLIDDPHAPLFHPAIIEATRAADLFVLNLEGCISERGERWRAPGKPFFFRAPPAAVDVLNVLGVDCVTLANNHALDYGHDALLDTFHHLQRGGIRWVGAGENVDRARRPMVLEANGVRVGVVGATDHPDDYDAGHNRAGVALAQLTHEVSAWLVDAIGAVEADIVLVTPHWGPNMTTKPLPAIAAAADRLVAAGATVVAGHSAHVFHGVRPPVLYDLGDFVDDYAVDPVLRNDLGLLFFVTIDGGRVARIEALPLKLGYCYTSVAEGEDARWIQERFTAQCRALGTEARVEGDRLVVASTPLG